MAKRAYSPGEVVARKYETIPWDGDWESAFGQPTINDTWFISGASASGKSSFVMQLAKKLCEYGKSLYVSLEEGIGQTFKDRLILFDMAKLGGKFSIATSDSFDDLCERLAKPKSAQFIIIDSFQFTGWTYDQARKLVERFPRKAFIFISQEDKGAPLGKGAVRLRYLAGVKVKVSGFKAYCQGRYTGEAGTFYPVWEEGILRVENGIK